MRKEELNVDERLQVIEKHSAKQDELLNGLKNDIEKQGGEIKEIREKQENHIGELADLKEDVQKLELIIVQENKETRTILESMLNKQWDLIMSRDIAKGVFTNKIVDSLFKMFQVGGIVYLLADKFLN